MELLLECRLMLSILLDTLVNRILGHLSISKKLNSAHPVLSSPTLTMKIVNPYLAKKEYSQREKLFD